MNAVITTIVTAILAGATVAAHDISKQAIIDAYKALKQKIKDTFGESSKVNRAIEDLEEEPDLELNQKMIQHRVMNLDIDKHPDIIDAASKLLSLIEESDGGKEIANRIGNVIGENIAVAQGRGSSASVNLHSRTDAK